MSDPAAREATPTAASPSPSSSTSPDDDAGFDPEAPLIDAGDSQPSWSDEERSWGRRSQVAVAFPLAMAGLLLLVGLAFLRPQIEERFEQPVEITPRQLFESPRFRDLAIDNLAALVPEELSKHTRSKVQAHLDEHLRQVSADIWRRSPESGKALDEVLLTPEEQDGLITMMASVRNPRVHALGRNVSAFFLQSLGATTDEFDAKRRTVSALAPHFAEIRQLRDEVIPECIRGQSEVDDSKLRLDPEGLSFAKTIDHGWNVEVDVSTPQRDAEGLALPTARRLSSSSSSSDSDDDGDSSMTDMVKVLKMQAQAEKMFNQVQEFAATKYNVHIPGLKEATKGVDTSSLMKCGMEAVMAFNPRTVMQCGMQAWSVGMMVMQNIAKGIGPVTTTTEQTQFSSMADLMD